MKTVIVVGVGVLVAGGVAYYLYSKKKAAEQQALPAGSSSQAASSNQLSPPSPTTPTATPTVRQTMWKDVDGNIFELTSTKDRWGYVLKVNGGVQGKYNQYEVLTIGSDGHAVGADNNGSVFVYKNNGWQNVVRDNKTAAAEYMAKLGVKYPTGAFSGLGNSPYILN